MEISKETVDMLEQLPQPVFLTKDNIVVYANHSAQLRDVQAKTNIFDLIAIGHKEYRQFKAGKLLLTVAVSGILYNTVVTTTGAYHMFCLESEYSKPELRAFAVAAQALREPLTNVRLGIDKLMPDASIQESPTLLAQIKEVNKGLYQIHRAVRNMSDVATLSNSGKTELCDICKLLSEIVEKANTLLANTNHIVAFNKPLQHGICCQANRESLERAILNLVSNAIKYASGKGIVEISLRTGVDRLYISVQGECDRPRELISSNIFSAFTREPSIRDTQHGIGLGLTIVHSVAVAHKGTLLVEHPTENALRFTISICSTLPTVCRVNSPSMPIDNAGGLDNFLIELADILPAEVYE